MNSKENKFEVDLANSQNFYGTLFINNNEIPASDILSLVIREWLLSESIVPRLELTMIDSGRLSDADLPINKSEIKISISKSEESIDDEEMFFYVSDVEIINTPSKNGQRIIKISGLLKIDNLFKIGSSAFTGNSVKVISDIADELNLEFVKKNNISAQDNMTYFKLNQNNLSFLQHVLDRSYIGEDDLLFAFISINNTLNALSLKSAISAKPLWTLKYNVELATSKSEDEFKNLIEKLGIKEDKSTIYYSNFGLINKSGSFYNSGGYSIKNSFYDINKKEIIETESNSSLKLNKTDYDNINENKITAKFNYSGVSNLYNTYEGYDQANSNKENLILSLFAQTLEVEIDSFKTPEIGDSIEIFIPTKSEVNSELNNEILSGKYIIISRLKTLTKSSILKKRIIIARVGTNKGLY